MRLPVFQPAGASPRLHPGQMLAERYLIRRFVDAGGIGEVYEADDRDRAERVAVKIFRPEFGTGDHLAWLRREVDMAPRAPSQRLPRV